MTPSTWVGSRLRRQADAAEHPQGSFFVTASSISCTSGIFSTSSRRNDSGTSWRLLRWTVWTSRRHLCRVARGGAVRATRLPPLRPPDHPARSCPGASAVVGHRVRRLLPSTAASVGPVPGCQRRTQLPARRARCRRDPGDPALPRDGRRPDQRRCLGGEEGAGVNSVSAMKVASIVGARPQFIKAAPVSRAIEPYNITRRRCRSDS